MYNYQKEMENIYKSMDTDLTLNVIKKEVSKLVWPLLPDRISEINSTKIFDFLYEKRKEVNDEDLVFIISRVRKDISTKEVFDYFLDKTLELNKDLVGYTSIFWYITSIDHRKKYIKILNKENSMGFKNLELLMGDKNKTEILLKEYYAENHYSSVQRSSDIKTIACDNLNKWILCKDVGLFFKNKLLDNDYKSNLFKESFEEIVNKGFISDLDKFTKNDEYILHEVVDGLISLELKYKPDLIKQLFDIRDKDFKNLLKKTISDNQKFSDGILKEFSVKEKKLNLLQELIIDNKGTILSDLCLESECYFKLFNEPLLIDNSTNERNFIDTMVDENMTPTRLLNSIYITNYLKGVEIDSTKEKFCKFILMSMKSLENGSEQYHLNLEVLKTIKTDIIRENLNLIMRDENRKDIEILINKRNMEDALVNKDDNQVKSKIKI